MTVQQYITYAEHMLRPTKGLFLLVPQDSIHWKPTEKSFTTGQLMAHIALSLRFNADGIGKNEWALPSLRHVMVANRRIESRTIQECLELYEENAAYYLQTFQNMENDDFQLTLIDTPQFGKQEKWRYALFSIAHHLNHKAELFMYLKFLGVNVGTGELYGKES